MKKLIQFLLVPALFLVPLLTPSSAFAADPCDNALFGLVPWNCGIGEDVNSFVTDTNSLSNAIWTIVANVATDLTILAAYLVLGFVIYGGYLYILAAGDTGKVATGKKTLSQAFIGLAIVLSANVILGAIRVALGNNIRFSAQCASGFASGSAPAGCADIASSGDIITSIIQWVIGIAGLIAVIFVVYGAIAYITSAGDAGRVAKAKNVIVYSLIGLAIVALAEIGTAFVSNLIRQSISYINPASTFAQTLLENNNYTIHERSHYVKI